MFVRTFCYTEGTCPAPAPCSCVGELINCEARRLRQVPTLTKVHDNFHTLNLGTNNIDTILSCSFINLNLTHLFLDYNNIRQIENNAFRGLEHLKVLHLQHNRLLTLPTALKAFSNLEELDISYNLIDGERTENGKTVDDFTQDVAKHLGKSLTSFKFGDPLALMHWPGILHHLQQLENLYVSGCLIHHLPPLPFRAFEHTLKKLWIEKTQLEQLPLEIGRLTRIRELHVNYNSITNGESIIVDTVFAGIGDTLEVLTLEYDNLSRFPDSVKYLVNMKNLSLVGNHLVYVSDEAIRSIGNGNLIFLGLGKCGLNRIPGALSNLTSLLVLDLSENNIQTIESQDLANLTNLVSVSFGGNPLKYISRASFHGLPSLEKMDLSRTNVILIPEAIQNLPSIKQIDLSYVPVDCTCDLVWMKQWIERNDMNIYVRGRCETIASALQAYIEERLPHCLEYSGDILG